MRKFAFLLFVSFVSLVPSQHALAVEILSAEELASHCEEFPNDKTSLDGEFCARYIQGFIDGAVSTDARVMLNTEAEYEEREETFTERAIRTRMPGINDYRRAARYAEFCLGDPVPLEEVVINVVNDLAQRSDLSSSLPARDTVYASLIKHYPCEPE